MIDQLIDLFSQTPSATRPPSPAKTAPTVGSSSNTRRRTTTDQATLLLGRRSALLCIICNVILCVSKGLAGMFAGSISLVADALNNLSDASGNIVELGGFYLAGRPADHDHPYGHGRWEYLTGLAVSVIICGVGINLIISSVGKILNPAPAEFNAAVVGTLLFSIAVKLWMAAFLSRGAERFSSQTLKAASRDSTYDVICTSAILLAAVIGTYSGLELDGIMGAAVGIYICVGGVSLVLEAVSPLLGEAPGDAEIEHIRQKILSYPGILGTHDLLVHDYGLGRRFASAHVEMAGEQDSFSSHEIIDTIEQDFLANEGLLMTLHCDPIVTEDPNLKDLRHRIDLLVKKIDPRLSVHDVRLICEQSGEPSERIVFDCLLPPGFSGSSEASSGENLSRLREHIVCSVQEVWPDTKVEIQFDAGFLSPNNLKGA